ncbi:MAG: hypothetical protein DCC49_05220 [Acidobacteria bacterium]|nr:MAG: hypothetical protein DCC49_05220 [Acidobacteriota bacterium]
MQSVTIVGAGLSGLTAGIILARDGYEVTVLEEKERVGGASLTASAVAKHDISFADMTPLDLGAINRYLGFDLAEPAEPARPGDPARPAEPAELTRAGHARAGSLESAPFCNPLPVLRLRVYGKVIDLEPPPGVHMKTVERGARESSLDMRLYELAIDAGVKFSFKEAVRRRQDFAELPPNSIIATGMFRHAFDALDIPYSRAHGYFAGGPAGADRSPYCVAYFNEHTRDYAYFASANGVGAAVLFQRRKPLTVASMEWFPAQLAEDEGIEFTRWDAIDNLVGTPTGTLWNPRLFSGNLILTGTLAGMQDPSMVLGVHGALVSGKIAAMAVSSRDGALAEFRRLNRWWKVAYLARRVLWATHPWGPRAAMPQVLKLAPHIDQRYVWMVTPAIPGWMHLDD